VDPFEVIFSGVGPFLLPLFVGLPFNIRIIYMLNFFIMLHGEIMHSAYPTLHSGLSGWLLLSPTGHNWHHMHHTNQGPQNFGIMFKGWDRLLGTLCERQPDWSKGTTQD
jgi:sterol desaturase/sphingolipid hydroxylase (fatty acid hydroxylase superfamily)